MIKTILISFLVLFTLNASSAEFKDLIFAGYQGWFATPGDGVLNHWNHYTHGNTIPAADDKIKFDIYPDLREYSPADLAPTLLGPLGNGTPARLFSSAKEGVVDVHFRWMKQYGIDGIALQRFLVDIQDPPYRVFRNHVTELVMKKAEKYQRHFYITYDITGMHEGMFVQTFKRDLEVELENYLKVFNSPWYAKQNGKPVIGVWGFGFEHNRPTAPQAREIIQWLKDKGYYVMGGVPVAWRFPNGAKPGFLEVYKQFDMIQPWTIGAYETDQDIQRHFTQYIRPDIAFCEKLGIDYQTTIWPGFSWHNMFPEHPKNHIPRRRGEHFWKQVYLSAVVKTKFMIAMFDEYDEGTAIAKAAENKSMIPQNKWFLTLDADGAKLSSDFYLRLAGRATQVIKNTKPLSPTVDINFVNDK